MNTSEFLSYLRSLDVRLFAEGERLRIRAPKGALTSDLHSELTKRKAEILELLQETGGSLQTGFLSQLEDTLDLEAPVILPVTRDRPLPLSFVQERLWILDQLVPGNTTYNLGGALAIEGPLDVKALEDSLSEIVRRHEILRTSFSADDGIPQQVIAPAASFQLPCIMLNDVPEEKREQKIQELINREARRPFDLARGPLFRACLLCVDKDSHVLLLNMHHIVTDGWSMGVLFKELSVIYDAKVTKTEVSLPPLPIQYADYAVWQRGWLNGKTLAKQLSYWKQQLEGAPAVLELPHDRPRPALQNFVGGRLSLSLSDSLGKALRSLSSREGATLFMILLSAFKVLLYRYTGQEDVVVGSPIAGRNRKETEGLIGFFINNLVLRTSLSGNPTFRQLLARVLTVALDAYTHQDVPFEKLVEELRPERDVSRTPFFQVFFNTFNLDGGEPRLPGLRVKRLKRSEAQSKFDLTIYARAEGDNIHFTVVYNADLFRADRINEMLAQLESLLTEAVRNPDRRIADFSLVTGRAEKRLPDPTQPLNADWEGAVHTHFSLQAQTFPQRLAVIDKWGVWTYKDLDSRSNQLANYLRHSGIEPHDIVAIYGHRSASLVLAVLGILKAGAAFVILDPAYPATRLIDCLQVAKPRGWLHVEAAGPVPDLVEEFIESSPLRCRLELSRDSAAISHDSLCGYSTADPGVVVGPDDLAYVAFTSGSAGRPKGILGRHGSLSHFLPWQEETFDLGAPDRFSMLSGLSHDPLQRDLFTPLWLGATICIPDPEIIGTAKLAEWMAKEEITFAHLTPPMAELLTETAAPDCRIPSLRYAFFVGDKLTQRDVVRLRSLASGVTCINSYGSTETQRAVGCYVVPQSSDSEQSRDKSVYPLGRGMKDVQLLVLTAEQRLAGVGELGEIHVRSPHLALGYLGDEALTRMRFLTNPFTGVSGDRLYKTGDLGRYLPDGNVEFAGRVDRQVKIRGFRIEPEEVEAVLGQQPSIQQALVLVREDVPDQKRLVAYLIARAEALTPSELRNFVKSKLPDYMVPSAFVYLDALPLTPNGKVDTEALPAADHHRPELEEVYVAPRSPVEQMLAEIWAGLLKLEQVGVHDNFFDLGGHSLLAAQLISRIRESFQIELPLRTLFERPSVAEIAKRVEEARGKYPSLSTRPLVPVSRDKDLPLSFSQQRLWFLDQYEPNSSVYNIPSALRLRGSLNIGALEQSLNEIIRRHESLRTTFSMVDGEPVQLIAPSVDFSLVVVDLSEHPEGEREEEAQRLVDEEARRPFDLAQGPPFRSKLVRLGEDDHVLLLTMHHIVSDGWSMGVLHRELSVLYEAFSRSEPSSLSEPPIQYADYAVWQREWLQGGELDRQLSYWKKQLGEITEVLYLPTDHPRPAVQSFRGGRQSLVLSKDLSDGLKALSRKEGVTLFMTFLGVFQALLYRYTGQEDIVVGSPIANRNRSEIEGLIGFFVNTLVLRTDLSGTPSFRELLQRVRKTALEAYDHQDLPFEKLVEELKPERNLSYSPLFQVMFVLQNAPTTTRSLKGVGVEPLRIGAETSKFDLTLSMSESEDGLRGSLQYSTDLFNDATIARMIGHLQTLIEALVADPEQHISQLPILTDAEKRQLLVEWNDTRDYPQDKCLQQLFEEQMGKTPDAVAIAFEDNQLTYGELNRRANQLAHYLSKLGVGPEVSVALCVERSLEMVVAMLGVLKAGGAYVPLDPSYPKERLAFILRDAQASVLVTQERLVDKLPEFHGPALYLDTGWSEIEKESGINPVCAVCSENLAYVIYTSGSTGKPKGVQVPHRAVVNFLNSMSEQPGLTPTDTLVAVTTLSFDIVGLEIFLPLCVGARIVLVSSEAAADGSQLASILESSGATVMQATPASWRLLMQAGWRIPKHFKVLCGGEELPREVAAYLLERASSVWNMYGPTETTIWSASERVESVEGAIPIGRPIANTQIYILDNYFNPVPVGVHGELYIGGIGVARGYRNRPELVAEKFVPDPFSSDRGARLYKTGDRARYLSDGKVEFLGRMDYQTKLRGFRIELGEIEAILGRHPSVTQAVVAIKEISGDRRLIGYVIPRDECVPNSTELREFLRTEIPEYMVPSGFVFLDSLPLTPNGKVNRLALPLPDASRPDLADAFVAPRNPVEEVVAGVWAAVLGLQQVGVHDNFFDLGGHSLLATRVMYAMRDALQVDLPLRTLFEKPTISDLAEVILKDPLSRDKVERTAQLFLKLSQLSTDEVETLLSKRCSLLRESAE